MTLTSRCVSAPGAVAGGVHLLLGELLDLGEVVVAVAHALAQLGVRATRLLGRRDRLARAALQLAVQPDDRLERLVGDAAPGRIAGRPSSRRAELACARPSSSSSAARRLGGSRASRSASFDPERRPRCASSVESFGSRLPFSMRRELAAREADRVAQLVEGEAARDRGSGGCGGRASRGRGCRHSA